MLEKVDIKILYVSADGFSDIKSQLVIHFLVEFLVPSYFRSFIISYERRSAENIDRSISSQFKD